MPLDPQAQAVMELLSGDDVIPFEELTPGQAREQSNARRVPSPEPIFATEAIDAGGVPARLYRPNAHRGLPLLVYLHGGGWVIGDLESHDDLCRRLANLVGCLVLSINYRLAPEHPFPAPLEDAIVATRWAIGHAAELGADANRVAIGGDSAGGNLAAAVVHSGVGPLRFQLLVYPVTDGRCSTDSYSENGSGYFLTADAMSWFYDHYLSGGVGSRTDPRVSPLLAADTAFAGQPSAFVITAEYDPLRDEGEAYAARLRDAGVSVTAQRYNGVIHGFFSMSQMIDIGATALNDAAAALRAAFAG
jgi:acetyl esterase